MKKILGILVLAMAAQVAMAGAFPRKFLIEHFTGDQCGYCPGGMMAITETVENEPGQYVWISNHAGFNSDEYTIAANNTYVTWYGVQGAPSMVLNRTKRRVDGSNTLNFHPGWLPDLTIEDDRTSDVEVKIQNDYNPETRELTVTVSGQVADPELTTLRVTVWLKENGLVGKQADYQYCYNTWAKYLHPCVMRKAVSGTKGDAINVEDGRYTYTKTFTLSEAWDANNCMTVAVAHPNKTTVESIYNVDELPVVAGTTGGAEYLPEAILMTEKKPTSTSITAVRIEFGENQDGVLPVYFISGTTKTAGSFKAYPVAEMLVKTEGDQLPENTTFALDSAKNDFIPGSYNEEKRCVEGSILWYAERDMLNTYDYIFNLGNWLIKGAKLTYRDRENAELIFTTMKGYQISFTIGDPYTAVEEVKNDANASKSIENGHVVIRRGDNVYTTGGLQIR